MHLVFLNQYFPPDDAPTGRVLAAVAEELRRNGHEVTVLCSAAGGYTGVPASGECLSGHRLENESRVRVIRLGATAFGRGSFVGKLVDYLSFYLGVVWRLATLRPGPDRVVALTTPPLLSLLARGGSKLRGGDHAHWVMDLYPDVMVAHGMLRAEGVAHRGLRALARWGLGGGRNAGVLVLGPDMAERTARLVEHGAVDWVPLWATASETDEAALEVQGNRLRRERGWDGLVMMYSGNMGLGHRFHEFLEAARLAEVGERWVFFGGGKRRGEVQAFSEAHPDARLELHDYVSHETLAAHLRSADVHLASLEPGWEGTMVPSKLQGIAAVGRPILFVGSDRSSIGRWIAEGGAGWVVPPEDSAAMRKAIREAADPGQRARRGEAAAALARKLFQADRNIARSAAFLSRSDDRA